MVTMKQMRNVVFSILNQSKFNSELGEVIKKAEEIQDYTVKLNEQDRQLDHKLGEEVIAINNASRKYQQEQAALHTQTTKRLATHANEIKTIQEGSKRQKDLIEDQSRNIGTLTESIQKVNARIEKVRENLQDEIGRQKEEIDGKINEVEMYQNAQFDRHQNAIENQATQQTSEMGKLKDHF